MRPKQITLVTLKNSFIDKLAWLCIQDKKLLCARSKSQTIFYIPGGKREAHEGDKAALMREVKEELSVNLLPRTITYAHTFLAQAHGKPEGTQLQLTCYYADYEGEIQASSEIEEARWFNYKDKPFCSLPLQMIMDWLKEREEIE